MPPRKSADKTAKQAKSAAGAGKRSAMSAAHKEALAVGRAQGRVVRRYLDALEANRPRRGRKRTDDSIKRQLAQIESKLSSADPLQKLHLIQARQDLTSALGKTGESSDDIATFEAEFIDAAKAYGERKGISYATWREAGVPAKVLERSGIHRGA
ncbi:MAG TPA: hypothetical protein VGS21_10445 [Acidimicrobiales bacterium]|nr:hypothetical protein [Acidimicrobiales bacterium]